MQFFFIIYLFIYYLPKSPAEAYLQVPLEVHAFGTCKNLFQSPQPFRASAGPDYSGKILRQNNSHPEID